MKNKKMKFSNNKIRLALVVFMVSFTNVNGQKITSKVIYKKKSSTIIDSTKQKTSARIFAKNMSRKMNNLEYTLKFNSKESIFSETSKMSLNKDNNSLAIKLSKLLGGGNGIFYTNRKLNKTYHQKEFQSEVFLIEQEIISDWKLTQEKKIIGKFTCFKATKNDTYVGSSGNLITKNITAWYTTEIPYSYGPLKYNGLPGLILELENDKAIFYATKIDLFKKNMIEIIKKPKKGIKITQKKYDSIVSNLAKDFQKKRLRN
ncbi:GLPGLI family protein [Polaribacter sp. HL-MS24]|uniref:GLPGLI family protein n=1 Tax=Polaribacter sp. HL-MS24 TaxID=3077735 RepID=UPI0029350A72|nr:GLPGLI family protein [Polaribacter sp. HL-MS24]WOC39614.1 GLPGLI family protein [Polaribacter sp. HL-MS24]